MAADLHDIRQRLESISSDLADLALDRLRAALDSADGDPAAQERLLTRARRSVDKAGLLLRQVDEL